jgi:hypothetical protein
LTTEGSEVLELVDDIKVLTVLEGPLWVVMTLGVSKETVGNEVRGGGEEWSDGVTGCCCREEGRDELFCSVT